MHAAICMCGVTVCTLYLCVVALSVFIQTGGSAGHGVDIRTMSRGRAGHGENGYCYCDGNVWYDWVVLVKFQTITVL